MRYCKCTSFQANHNPYLYYLGLHQLFAILQMYEFSSKSQPNKREPDTEQRCLRYRKCTSFTANHNRQFENISLNKVVCDTANVRVFKQITTICMKLRKPLLLFAILQMYEFSSKSQQELQNHYGSAGCLRYCKCTSFQANHNLMWK